MDEKINRIIGKINFLHIELKPTINLDKINDYEKRFNIKLPETYVLYLTEIQNGGHSNQLSKKGPYYGIYSFEKSLEENRKWQIDINEKFKLTKDLEIEGNKKLIKKYQHTGTINGTLSICEYGDGDFFRLIVRGEKAGEIFVDSGTIEGVGYYFLNVDILTFYENWLDKRIENNDKLIKAYYSFLEFGKNDKYKVAE